MAAVAQDLERRVSELEGDKKVIVANYESLLKRVVEHMDDEEKARAEQNAMLKQIFDLIRDIREKAGDMDDKLEEKIKKHIEDNYLGKLEAEKNRNALDKKISRAYWVASGISSAVPIIWLIYLIITNINKIAGTQ